MKTDVWSRLLLSSVSLLGIAMQVQASPTVVLSGQTPTAKILQKRAHVSRRVSPNERKSSDKNSRQDQRPALKDRTQQDPIVTQGAQIETKITTSSAPVSQTDAPTQGKTKVGKPDRASSPSPAPIASVKRLQRSDRPSALPQLKAEHASPQKTLGFKPPKEIRASLVTTKSTQAPGDKNRRVDASLRKQTPVPFFEKASLKEVHDPKEYQKKKAAERLVREEYTRRETSVRQSDQEAARQKAEREKEEIARFAQEIFEKKEKAYRKEEAARLARFNEELADQKITREKLAQKEAARLAEQNRLAEKEASRLEALRLKDQELKHIQKHLEQEAAARLEALRLAEQKRSETSYSAQEDASRLAKKQSLPQEDFWSKHVRIWKVSGREKGPELFNAIKNVWEDSNFQPDQEGAGRRDGLPTSKDLQQRLTDFAVQALRTDRYLGLSFLNPDRMMMRLPVQAKRSILLKTQNFLKEMWAAQNRMNHYGFSMEEAFEFEDFETTLKHLPKGFSQTTEESIKLFREVRKLFPTPDHYEKVLRVISVLTEVVNPMDLEHWKPGVTWEPFVTQTLKKLVQVYEDAETAIQDPDDAVRQEGNRIAENSFKKRTQKNKESVRENQKNASHAYMNKISTFIGMQKIQYTSWDKKDPFEIAIEVAAAYPDGTPGKQYPFSVGAAGKKYRWSYETIFADPFAAHLDVPDEELRKIESEITLLQGARGILADWTSAPLSGRWYDFKKTLEEDLKKSPYSYVFEPKMFGKDFESVWDKFNNDYLARGGRHEELARKTMARLFRLYESMKKNIPNPDEALRDFYSSVAQNTGRCIDGLNQYLTGEEQRYVYIIPKTAPRGDLLGVKIAKIFRDARHESLDAVVGALFPSAIGAEPSNYGKLNTTSALRHAFGLGGENPDGNAYGLDDILPPQDFIRAWAWGGKVSYTKKHPYTGNIIRTNHTLNAFSPEVAAELVKKNVGMGKMIEDKEFDDLTMWDLDLRQAREEWETKVLDDENFENDFFKGSDVPHKAMKHAGYYKILQRFGYVEELP